MKRRAILPRTIAAENDRDRPTGAGAAPGRQEQQPRAGSRRGRRDGRSAKFYELLGQMPPARAQAAGESHTRSPMPSQTIIRGEFLGLAYWIAAEGTHRPSQQDPQPERPAAMGGIFAQGEDPAEGNSELSA